MSEADQARAAQKATQAKATQEVQAAELKVRKAESQVAHLSAAAKAHASNQKDNLVNRASEGSKGHQAALDQTVLDKQRRMSAYDQERLAGRAADKIEDLRAKERAADSNLTKAKTAQNKAEAQAVQAKATATKAQDAQKATAAKDAQEVRAADLKETQAMSEADQARAAQKATQAKATQEVQAAELKVRKAESQVAHLSAAAKAHASNQKDNLVNRASEGSKGHQAALDQTVLDKQRRMSAYDQERLA